MKRGDSNGVIQKAKRAGQAEFPLFKMRHRFQ